MKALWVVALCGCATFTTNSARFITVSVTSENWDATALSLACANGVPLATVHGLMRGQTVVRNVSIPQGCYTLHTAVRMLGGMEVRGEPTDVHMGDTLFIHIPPYIGAGYRVNNVVVVDPQWLDPLGLHAGIWHDVEKCLGLEASPAGIRWGVARLLIGDGGVLAYGVTAFNSDTGEPFAIILDQRGFWTNSTVISHEIVHAITGSTEHGTEELEACTMPTPFELPVRIFPPDSIAKYRGTPRR